MAHAYVCTTTLSGARSGMARALAAVRVGLDAKLELPRRD